MNQIELLSPAKDLETGIAAIDCGADAVYLGAPRFGAREAAGNSAGDIERLAAYAHKYWAKVYVTLNTLLYDHELEDARALAYQVYQAGADALIIQDPALIDLDLPPLPLFASTQMHNATPERVVFLEHAGFQRAILARELSLDQIREIRSRTSIELETFVHGALCVSYSGQCYLSYAIGGRSGNRGQCAQPCRRVYSLVGRDGQIIVANRYLLSLRDLNLSAHLAELIAAGANSFKIEGRLKDLTYVRNIVGTYRKCLDEIIAGSAATGTALQELKAASSGKVQLDFDPDPARTFNRGYTTYFLKGRGAEIANPVTPKSLGEPLGPIHSLGKNYFSLAPDYPAGLNPGDGLCFVPAQGGDLAGTSIHRVEGNKIYPESLEGLAVGVFVYRNHDREFSDRLMKSRAERKIAVRFHLERNGQEIRLSVSDEDGIQAAAVQTMDLPAAEQVERIRDTILRQLSKLGETEFECVGVTLDLAPLPFLPLGRINALRREAIDALTAERARRRPIGKRKPPTDQAVFPQGQLSFEGNVLNRVSADFYRRHGVEQIEPAAESGLDMEGRRVMTTKLCLRYELKACPKLANPVRLPEPLALVDEQGMRYPLKFNCKDCVMEVFYKQG
jgi:putative protease